MNSQVVTLGLRWAASMLNIKKQNAAWHGRWIVMILLRANDRWYVIRGYRFSSKARARKWARRQTRGAFVAVVRRYRKRDWKPRSLWQDSVDLLQVLPHVLGDLK